MLVGVRCSTGEGAEGRAEYHERREEVNRIVVLGHDELRRWDRWSYPTSIVVPIIRRVPSPADLACRTGPRRVAARPPSSLPPSRLLHAHYPRTTLPSIPSQLLQHHRRHAAPRVGQQRALRSRLCVPKRERMLPPPSVPLAPLQRVLDLENRVMPLFEDPSRRAIRERKGERLDPERRDGELLLREEKVLDGVFVRFVVRGAFVLLWLHDGEGLPFDSAVRARSGGGRVGEVAEGWEEVERGVRVDRGGFGAPFRGRNRVGSVSRRRVQGAKRGRAEVDVSRAGSLACRVGRRRKEGRRGGGEGAWGFEVREEGLVEVEFGRARGGGGVGRGVGEG